jgi:hypothetical protein
VPRGTGFSRRRRSPISLHGKRQPIVRLRNELHARSLSNSSALAALAFDDPVAFLQQALALAILALGLLLDVRSFFIGHWMRSLSGAPMRAPCALNQLLGDGSLVD